MDYERLTIFLVKENLKLVVQLMLEDMVYSTDCLLIGKFAEHKGTPAGFLHYFRPVVAGNLAERLVAINYRVVDDLGVRQKETAVGCNKNTCAHPSGQSLTSLDKLLNLWIR